MSNTGSARTEEFTKGTGYEATKPNNDTDDDAKQNYPSKEPHMKLGDYTEETSFVDDSIFKREELTPDRNSPANDVEKMEVPKPTPQWMKLKDEGKLGKHRKNRLRRPGRFPVRQESTIDIPGLTVSKRTENDSNNASYGIREKLIIILVGIPATGKSYIGSKLSRYYNWLKYNCRFFSVGDKRREEGASTYSMSADFFDIKNEETFKFRENVALETLEDLLHWMIHENGVIGILDATNSTHERRKHLYDRISKEADIGIMFLESLCTDDILFEENIKLKIKGPDYEGYDTESALKDLRERVDLYKKYYEPLDERDEQLPFLQYVKVINVGIKVVTHNIEGFLAGQAVYFMLNLNIQKRQIWLTRPGESLDTVAGRIGGDASLTPIGKQYAQDLANFMDRQRVLWQLRYTNDLASTNKRFSLSEASSFNVWSSVRKRAIETIEFFNPDSYNVKKIRLLNDLNLGSREGLTLREFSEKYPDEFDVIKRKDYAYRFSGQGGESYLDVIHRLQPLIVEIERSSGNVLVVSHRIVSNILMTYFLNYHPEDIIDVGLPLHTLFCIESDRYGTTCMAYRYDAANRQFIKDPMFDLRKRT
ncbi:6-phosphofructo-2-kinase [Schizosaccharomyces pombe]